MTRNWFLSVGALALLSLAACESDSANVTGPKGQEAFARYVAIGTSLTMGVQSDGVAYFTQQGDWTKLLAQQAAADCAAGLLLAARRSAPVQQAS
jgi:hypothetical protein